MRRNRLCRALLGVVAVVSAVLDIQAQTTRPDPVATAAHRFAARALESVPGLSLNPAGVLVKFPDDVGDGYKQAVRAMVGDGSHSTAESELGVELLVVRVPPHVALERLAPWVEYVERDRIVRLSQMPNDPHYGQLWGLKNTGQVVAGDPGVAGVDMRAEEAWSVTTGDAQFAIAVIDTGVAWRHPDLAANIWTNSAEIAGNGVDDDANGYIDDVRGWDFYGRDADPDDENGHGTHVAGTIGAIGNNNLGVVGVNWACQLVPLRFIGPQGGYVSDAVSAVDYCRRKGIKVSNNSWGGGGYSQALYDAIANARAAGHVFVAAAGNSGINADVTRAYPASFDLDNIISVAAANNDGLRAGFSNYGVRSVDLAAPGVAIYSTHLNDGYAHLQGTSMASPHVAGAAALVWARNPAWSYAQVRGRLLASVRTAPAWINVVATGGMLDLGNAVTASRLVNSPPRVVISAPRSSLSVIVGSPVVLAGTATDREDGDLSARIAWTSSVDGELGTGAMLTISTLSVGRHMITARVTDEGGLQHSLLRTVTVRPPPPPLAPAYFLARMTAPGAANLTWIDRATNELCYELERQQRINGVWTQTTTRTVSANMVQTADAPGTGVWRWRVRAVGSTGLSAWSTWKLLSL